MVRATDTRGPFRHLHVASAAAIVLALGLVRAVADSNGAAPSTTEQRVAKLIEELGASEFAEREKAQTELSQLGLAAFEALEEVQDHADIEVRLRARRLLQGLRGRLILGGDDETIRELLGDYDRLEEDARRLRLESIVALEREEAIPVLCRLARFEESEILSKHAALLAVRQDIPEDVQHRAAMADSIDRAVGMSRRRATDWLRAFAQSLDEPNLSLEAWRRYTSEEQELLLGAARETSDEILRDLKQTQIVTLSRAGLDDEALRLTNQLVGDSSAPRKELSTIVEGLGKRSAWRLVKRIVADHRRLFDNDRLLLYHEAEALLQTGEEETANKTALRAWQMPLQTKGGHVELVVELAKSPSSRASKEAVHLVVALQLQERGMFAWAEREYRGALSEKVNANVIDIRVRFLLSEMLHDQQQDQAAADVLRPLVEGLKNDNKLLAAIRYLGRTKRSVESRMHFFAACHYEAKNDRQRQMELLENGAEADPRDADVLIAMYHVPDAPQPWQTKTLDSIRDATRNYSKAIQANRMELERSTIGAQREGYRRNLARLLNEMAWLVGNTEGDVEEALRNSKESLKLWPGTAGYLDTLARCYFRLEDYENAVKYQRQAVRREPHSGQIKRQLQLFEQTLATSKQALNDQGAEE